MAAASNQIDTANFEDNVEKGKAGVFLTIPGMNASKRLFGGWNDKNVKLEWIEKTESSLHLQVTVKSDGSEKKYQYQKSLRKNVNPGETSAKIATTKKIVILLAKPDPQESWSGEDEHLTS